MKKDIKAMKKQHNELWDEGSVLWDQMLKLQAQIVSLRKQIGKADPDEQDLVQLLFCGKFEDGLDD